MAEHDELIAGTTNVLSLMRSPTFGVKAFLDEFIIERIEALTAALGEADAENARLRERLSGEESHALAVLRAHELGYRKGVLSASPRGLDREALIGVLARELDWNWPANAEEHVPSSYEVIEPIADAVLAAILNGEEPNNE